MTDLDLSHLPPALAARPRDEKRGLPIPAVNVHDGGVVDFVTLNGTAALRLAHGRRCSLCDEPLAGLAAFLGGPMSAEMGYYSDPPMHEACAQAALTLCPHIARPHARRASARRVAEDTSIPVGFTEEKPEEWVMVIASGYLVGATPAEGGGLVPLFVVRDRIRERRFVYQDGVLTETPAA
ncbi:hypothetical protein [Streptomyces sp. FH025]|uniref:hypothetical protein n=1 Tax=Streptomyces sp. FH025 TaxID=2815937 RepID=UPI001A9EDBB0|nr:hypothetical protein [Streptomyces sp. FH025]MBO1413197.1 hypothetical protein [Streptomyces sp. FH025]